MTDDGGQRIKGICAKCKDASPESMTTHHILPKRFFKGRTNITPFIDLCRKCHDVVERLLEKWEVRRRFHGKYKSRKPLKPRAYFKALEKIIGLDYLRYVYTISCWNFRAYFGLNDKGLPKPIWECQNPSCGRLYQQTNSWTCQSCSRAKSLKPIWQPVYQGVFMRRSSHTLTKSYAF